MNIRYPFHCLYMSSHKLCHIRRTDRIQRKPHGKQIVCVLSKRFSIKKNCPTSQSFVRQPNPDMPYRKSLPQTAFLLLQKINYSNNCRDHTTVNSKSTLTDIKNIFRLSLYISQEKRHIIKPCPNDRENHRINRQVKIIFLFLSGAFRLSCRYKIACPICQAL